MDTFDRSEIDPEGIYYLNTSGVVSAGEINTETGEVTEIENPAEHTHETKLTGRQVLALQKQLAEGKPARLDYLVRDEEPLVGEDGELIEADSAVPPDQDKP